MTTKAGTVENKLKVCKFKVRNVIRTLLQQKIVIILNFMTQPVTGISHPAPAEESKQH